MTRSRLRDLGIVIGELPTGPDNAITDVPGVWVGHTTLIYDQPRVARTGVTVIRPRYGEIYQDQCFAGYHSFNGNGEMTGLLWLDESGQLGTPIALTNTHQVGIVRDALVDYEARHHPDAAWLLPVVAETYDGWLNDINGFHITHDHVFSALDAAAPGPVAEGNVGGGTGMICHDFKGGIGASSRVVEIAGEGYTVGVLVQSNYGDRRDLRVDGTAVGRTLSAQVVPMPWEQSRGSGSIIIIVATDAPLLPYQCRRLAQRATVGLGRVGGIGHNGSGDIFLAFATGNHLPYDATTPTAIRCLPNRQMNPLFYATVEAVEEAILNSLTAAATMTGQHERVAHALPLDRLQALRAGWQLLG